MESERKSSDFGIWWLAFGYFACYAPYTLLTKSATKGLLPGQIKALDGFSVLPISVLASLVGMIVFLSVKGWWKYATHREIFGMSLPSPTKWTALSGVCTATIIMTTTLAYTFTGVSIVFIMLLMRGGVLMIAPVADLAAKRKVAWNSWAALALSLLAVVVADRGGEVKITVICAINVAAYLAAYFVRLRFMSRLAKSDDENANTRYFVEEQMVGSPLLVLALTVVAIGGWGNMGQQLRYGFTSMWGNQALWAVLTLGVLSQGTGIFGGLILLDKRENTFCVPVNRTSSILAGVVASYSIALLFKQKFPSKFEVAGASLVVVAIAFLSIPAILKKRRAALSAASTTSTEPAEAR